MVQKFYELFENVQQSKSILKKLGIPLDDEDYQVIRGMLEKTPGWVGFFTLLHFGEEKMPLDDLAQLYDRLKSLQPLLNRLPMPVDKYSSSEKLVDDLDRLDVSHQAKRLMKELNKQQQAQFLATNTDNQAQLDSLAPAFYKLPQPMQKDFFAKLRSLSGSNFIDRLDAFVEANGTGFYFEKINAEVDATPGAKVVYGDREKGYLVVRLYDYAAASALCGATLWCFRNSQTMWDTYAGLKTFNAQYTLYNFNVRLSDVHSMIGLTVSSNSELAPSRPLAQNLQTSHLKNDNYIRYDALADYFKEDWEALGAVFAPLASDERNKRKEFLDSIDTLEDYLKFKFEAGTIPSADEFKETFVAFFQALPDAVRQSHQKQYVTFLKRIAGYLIINGCQEEEFMSQYRTLPERDTDVREAELTYGLLYFGHTEAAHAMISATGTLSYATNYNEALVNHLIYEQDNALSLEMLVTIMRHNITKPEAFINGEEEFLAYSIPLLKSLMERMDTLDHRFSLDFIDSMFESEYDSGMEFERGTAPMWKDLIELFLPMINKNVEAKPEGKICSKLAVMLAFFGLGFELVGGSFDNSAYRRKRQSNNIRYTNTGITYLPDRKAWMLQFDDWTDADFTRFYDDDSIFKYEDIDVYVEDFDLNRLWNELDDKSITLIVELLQARGWTVDDGQDAYKILNRFTDDYDEEDDDDDQGYDEETGYDPDAEEHERPDDGEDLADVIEALETAHRYATESDTNSQLFNSKIDPIKSVFQQLNPRTYFEHDPISKDNKLTLLLPVNYVVENMTEDVLDEMEFNSNDTFELTKIVESCLKCNDGLFDPTLDSDSIMSATTFNDYVREQLPDLPEQDAAEPDAKKD